MRRQESRDATEELRVVLQAVTRSYRQLVLKGLAGQEVDANDGLHAAGVLDMAERALRRSRSVPGAQAA